MDGLFNLKSILLHLLNATILFVALNYFLYKPVRKFMNARAQAINDQIDRANETEANANTLLAESQKKLDQVDREVAGKLSEGHKRAQAQRAELIADARTDGDKILEKAQQEADALLKNAHEAMQRQASELALQIASAVLEREVKPEDHQKLVTDFLKKVG